MKKITLKRIVLSNWKSLNIDVSFNDGKTIIKGRNGIGKSSLQASWNWLLSGYTNAVSPKNHELFDNRFKLSHETPVASVKAWITINGIEYTIEKTAQAKFTRRRGTNEYVKENSDTYKILLDEIEISSTQFGEWLDHNICDTDMLVYCLDGSFFTVLAEDDKKKARKVLEAIVGEIKECDYKGDYSILNNDFAKNYTIEQIEEKTKNAMKPLRERMSEIPAIIKDKEKMLSEYEQLDYADLEQQIEEKKRTIDEIDDAILGKAKSIEPILGERDKIFEIINSKTLKLNECRTTYIDTYNAIRGEIKGKIKHIATNNATINLRNADKCENYDRKVAELEQLKREYQSLNEYIDVLRKRNKDIKSQVFDGDCCPYCGQQLPDEMLKDARAKFNNTKKDDLAHIVAQGKQTKEKLELLKKHIDALQVIVDAGVEMEATESALLLEQELHDYEESWIPYEDTKEFATLSKEIEDLKKSIPTIPNNDSDDLTVAKKAIINELGVLYQLYSRKSKVSELKAEIDALKCELRHIGNDIANHEMILDKCKEYIEERASIISYRINDKLCACKIQMWVMQKNGELAPSCTITDKDGVKYSTMNNSNRIKTAIELQELFCRYYDVQLPIFVDEASVFSINNMPNIDGQSIYLYASDDNCLITA